MRPTCSARCSSRHCLSYAGGVCKFLKSGALRTEWSPGKTPCSAGVTSEPLLCLFGKCPWEPEDSLFLDLKEDECGLLRVGLLLLTKARCRQFRDRTSDVLETHGKLSCLIFQTQLQKGLQLLQNTPALQGHVQSPLGTSARQPAHSVHASHTQA